MFVFKFGGASINNIERIKNTSDIIRDKADKKLLVVVSAMGKTTNALEKIAEAYFDDRKDDALTLFEQVKKNHLETVKFFSLRLLSSH